MLFLLLAWDSIGRYYKCNNFSVALLNIFVKFYKLPHRSHGLRGNVSSDALRHELEATRHNRRGASGAAFPRRVWERCGSVVWKLQFVCRTISLLDFCITKTDSKV